MKKFRLQLITLLCAAVILFSAACSTTESSLGITSPLPWQRSESDTHQERLEYRFTRYLGSDIADENNPDSVPLVITQADSTQVFVLKEGKSLIFDEDKLEYTEKDDKDCTLLTMTLTVKYLSDNFVPELFRGKTETTESAVVFSRYASLLTANFMFKHIKYADAENYGLYTNVYLYTDYAGTFTGSKKATRIKKDSFGEIMEAKKQKSVSGTYFDNEYVMFLVRSLETVKNASGMQKSFKAAVTADVFINNTKFTATPFIQKTAADLENIPVSQDVYRYFYSANPEQDAEYNIPCYFTQISLNQKKSGPPKTIYYSSVAITPDTFAERAVAAQKVPVKMCDYLYDDYNYIQYTQVYQLIKYSNTYFSIA